MDFVRRWVVVGGQSNPNDHDHHGSDDGDDDGGGDKKNVEKGVLYGALIEQQLSTFLKDPKRTLEPVERHEIEYKQYINYREIMLCRRLQCVWCRDPSLTLEEAFVQEPENSHETVHHIRKRLHDGFSDRYIVNELEQLYATKNLQSFGSWNPLQHVLKNAFWTKQLPSSKSKSAASDSEEDVHLSHLVNNEFPRAVGLFVTTVLVTLAVPPDRKSVV